jgi:uncharacterized Zn-binding protein involved in type VI secretion
VYPAARVTDPHVCSKVEPGPVPHVGGPILPLCAPKVVTGNQPQARLSDLAICVGPPDCIAMGSSTVLVHGLPAARLNDKTAHGGAIVIGLDSVLIGGPAFTLPPNVKVEGNSDFLQKTMRDLYFLSTTPTGQEIFKQLAASGKPVSITSCDENNGGCRPLNPDDSQDPNKGSGSTIRYNPDCRTNAFDKDDNMIQMPPQVALGHEMCHAVHNANGENQPGVDPNPPASERDIEREEAQTIGTGSYEGKKPSENSLRDDVGLGRRDNHYVTDGSVPGEPKPVNFRPGEPL